MLIICRFLLKHNSMHLNGCHETMVYPYAEYMKTLLQYVPMCEKDSKLEIDRMVFKRSILKLWEVIFQKAQGLKDGQLIQLYA